MRSSLAFVSSVIVVSVAIHSYNAWAPQTTTGTKRKKPARESDVARLRYWDPASRAPATPLWPRSPLWALSWRPDSTSSSVQHDRQVRLDPIGCVNVGDELRRIQAGVAACRPMEMHGGAEKLTDAWSASLSSPTNFQAVFRSRPRGERRLPPKSLQRARTL